MISPTSHLAPRFGMRFCRHLLLAALLASLPLAQPARAGFFSSNPTPPANVPGGAPTQAQYADPAQQTVRIDNLENEVRQLNGRIDELTHQIQVMQNLLQRSQEDNEFRFKQLEGGKPQKRSDAAPSVPTPSVAMAAPAAGMPQTTTAPPMQAASDQAPGGAPQVADADLSGNGFSIDAAPTPVNDGGNELLGSPPRALGTLPADAAGGPLDLSAIARGDTPAPPAAVAGQTGGFGEAVASADTLPPPETLPPPQTTAPSMATAPTTSPNRVAPPTQVASLTPQGGDPRTAYEAAYAKVVAGDYAGAEAGFKKFLADYPKDQLAGGAHYWLGETYYSRGQYRDAATSFLATYKDYPKSPKAADSLFKLGLSLEGLGETSAACATYGELTKKFPKAQPTLLTRVATQRTKLSCQ